ncbi:hypothetical protein BCR36DRAFT_316209 [Piromyces finnis]|uniref:Nucleoside phosphatase GDA1/CD39 n=1 Tax=Piromyces finnis TaxID=1754191 RepID=A0A1Y1VM28_9FUNG|nr:hypothetical protein BCR36DRAFT_316209 [Piromyces finnis]|eukprot:ORX59973.1 hypothetical protein BCR36DRAFT_316209 [Piromyces finnis]
MKQNIIILKTKSFLKHCKLNIDYWLLKGTRGKRIIVLSILFLISIFSGIFSIFKYNHSGNIAKIEVLDNSSSNWDKFRNYGIVVDAGSSGSRVQLYSWRDTNYLQTAFYQHNLTFSQLDGINNDGLPLIEKGVREGDNWQYKINRGISTFKDAPEEVGPKHIKLLMDPLLNIIPAEKISSTPVYIYATAGMRLLKDNERNAILSEACLYLKKNYNFLVEDCSKQIINISGEEEGLYGWLGLNYLKNGFSMSTTEKKSNNNQNIIPSYGVLDMGGASTQIAYDISSFVDKPSKEENVIKTELHKITGEKTTYNVYSTTFLGFGMNETRRRYLEALVKRGINYVFENFDLQKEKRSNSKSPIPKTNHQNDELNSSNSKSPMPSASYYQITEQKNSVAKSPLPSTTDHQEKNIPNKSMGNSESIINKDENIEELSNKVINDNGLNGEFKIKLDTKTSEKYYELVIHDPCLPLNAKQNEFKPIDLIPLEEDYDISDWRVDMKGTGDLDKCMSDVYPLLNKTEPCKNEPCLFNGVHTPVSDFSKMPFYGISEYWYTSHDVHKQGGAYNYDKFYNSAKNLCNTNWEILDNNYKDGQYSLIYDEYLLFLSCFRSAWVMTVLHDGIGITKSPTFSKRDLFNKTRIEDANQTQEDINNILLNSRATIPESKEELIPFTTINEYNGYQVSWTLGVILNFICSTISESLDYIDFGPSKEFTLTVFLFGMTSIVAMIAVISLILYFKYGNQRLQYTEILPVYDNSSKSKLKNRYREVISLENITNNNMKMKPSESFNSVRVSNSSMASNPKITNIITKELPFRVNSDLQQYLSGEGTPNELKRVNSFTMMKKNSDIV